MREAQPEGRARAAKPEVEDCMEEGDGGGAWPGGAGPRGGGPSSDGGRGRAAALSHGCRGRRPQVFPPGSTGIRSDQIRSVAQLCPTLCDPMNRSTPGLPVHHHLPEFTQTHVHRVSDAIQPSHPLFFLLLPPIPPSIRVFSNESTLRMRWPKYWSFSFSIIPSKEIQG